MAANITVLHAENILKEDEVVIALKNDPDFQDLLDFNDNNLIATIQESLFTSRIVDSTYAEQVKKLVSTLDTLIEFELANYARNKGLINKVYGADDIMPLKMKCLIKATAGRNKVDLELLTTEMSLLTFKDFDIDMSDTDETRFEVLQGISKLAHEWLRERNFVTGTVWWPKSDFDLKILILGPVAVGKTSTQIRFHVNQFGKTKATTGLDKTTSLIELPNHCKVRVDIWDTAGSEKFNSITAGMLRGVDGVMIVYDASDKNMTENGIIGTDPSSLVNKHFYKLKPESEYLCPIVYFGNKMDLPGSLSRISTENKSVMHFVGSALSGENIKLAYNELLYVSAMLKYNRRRFPGGPDHKEQSNTVDVAAATPSPLPVKQGCC